MNTYLDRALLDIRPDFKSPSPGQLDDFSCVCQGIGKATPWKATSVPKRTFKMDFLFGTPADSYAFRAFFDDRANQRKGFWAPVWLNEYRLTADASASATVLTVEKSGLGPALASFAQFGYLAVATWTKIECYRIDHVVTASDHETITLTSGLITALSSSQTICGGLVWARISDDRIDYAYKCDLVSRSSVTLTELPTEYATEYDGAAPIFLYEIKRGASTWLYANCGSDLVIGSDTWLAKDITNTAITFSIDIVSNGIDVVAATDDSAHPFRYAKDREGISQTFVNIYKTDLDTLTVDKTKPVFAGRVKTVDFDDLGKITAHLSSIERVAETQAPRIQQQRLCNNRLFDTVCSLDPAGFTTSGTVSALASSRVLPYVEASAFATKATAESDPNWFALGKVTIGEEVRLVTGQDSSRLYLNAPFKSVTVGATVAATPGCDKRLATCIGKYDNAIHHLGFPYMPNTDPNVDALTSPKPAGGKKG